MDYCKIGGRNYEVIVLSIEEDFNILHSEESGRTIAEGAPMVFDPYGTYYGHTVTFKRRKGYEAEYDALWDYVSTPRYSGIPVEIVHNQSTLKYTAYVSAGKRTLKNIDERTGKVYWGEFQLKITPVKAQVLP